MMQTIDYRLELLTVHVADNQLRFEFTHSQKNCNLRPHPNINKIVFEQYAEH